MFVGVEGQRFLSLFDFEGHDLLLEAPFGDGFGRPLMAFQGQLVLVLS